MCFVFSGNFRTDTIIDISKLDKSRYDAILCYDRDFRELCNAILCYDRELDSEQTGNSYFKS